MRLQETRASQLECDLGGAGQETVDITVLPLQNRQPNLASFYWGGVGPEV